MAHIPVASVEDLAGARFQGAIVAKIALKLKA